MMDPNADGTTKNRSSHLDNDPHVETISRNNDRLWTTTSIDDWCHVDVFYHVYELSAITM